jgi:hypothetical protein
VECESFSLDWIESSSQYILCLIRQFILFRVLKRGGSEWVSVGGAGVLVLCWK